MNAMTADEHRAMEITVDLVNHMAQKVIGFGPTRSQDLAEFTHVVHRIQQMIMSQAAARTYPELYRALGLTFEARE